MKARATALSGIPLATICSDEIDGENDRVSNKGQREIQRDTYREGEPNRRKGGVDGQEKRVALDAGVRMTEAPLRVELFGLERAIGFRDDR